MKKQFRSGMMVQITHNFSKRKVTQMGKVLSVKKGLIAVESLANLKTEKILKPSLFNQAGLEIDKHPSITIQHLGNKKLLY